MSNQFLYDNEALNKIVPQNIYKQGLLYFKQDRVIEAYEQDQKLIAKIEGGIDDLPYDLELSIDSQDNLVSLCDCHSLDICKHAVAALLSLANDLSHQDTHGSARDIAIKDRMKRGQTEVNVKHLSGHPIFGTWQAASVVSSTHWQQHYQVHIRSLSQSINFCSCPDLSVNQLGTCKHIEATLYFINKNLNVDNQQPLMPFVYVSADRNRQIKLQRTDNISDSLLELCDKNFDSNGEFIGQIPSDFYKFRDQIFGREDISIGPDVHLWIQQLTDQQGHQLQTQYIVNQLKLSDGQLPDVQAKLYPYQIDGVAFLAGNGRALLADDMGLGKTLQAISATTLLMQHSGVKRTLIICPASLKHQWAREIEKFTGLKTQIVQGSADKRQTQYRQDVPFFIMNYELVLRDLTTINKLLIPDLLILDEAQRVKNWRTKIASSVKLIRSDYTFVLTGTPLENRLEDLYSLMQLVDSNVLGPLWKYLSDFHISDDKGKVLGYRNLGELRKRLEPVMLRRNRSIVSDQLPAKVTTQLDFPMTNMQLELHDTAMSTAGHLAQIAKRRPLTPSERNRMMAALQQARMACDAAGLVDKKTKGSPKLKELKNLIEEFCLQGGLKIVIFSQWIGMTNMVQELVQSMSLGYVHLNGQVPTSKRGELMDKFQNDDATCVFISTDAGGTGLNLQAGSVVINMDIPWNPAVLEQRNARVHRLGQVNKVQIVLMVSANSYEERVLQLVNNKQLLFDNVISEDATEDVVGLSKQSITTVINDLNLNKDKPIETSSSLVTEQADIKEILPEALSEPKIDAGVMPILIDEQTTNIAVQALQREFGSAIEQIMAKEGGLLVILDQMTEQAEIFIDQLSSPVPIALIDIKTRRMLERLGSSSPISDAKEISLTPKAPWLTKARKQLASAQILLEQQMDAGVIELLCSCATFYLTDKAGLAQVMSSEEATVWIYSQELGQQLLTPDETMELSKIFSLRFNENLPAVLLHQTLDNLAKMLA